LIDKLMANDPTKRPFKVTVDAYLKKRRLQRQEASA